MNLGQPNNPVQNAQDQGFQDIISKINQNLKSIDMLNPKGLIQQNVKNDLGLNFKMFGNSLSRNTQISPPENIYFLTHNLRSGLEKAKKEPVNSEDFYSKYNMQKFEQISRNVLNREKDFYREFIDLNGSIGIKDLNLENNITSKLRKAYEINPFNYMQENSEFDINNNKMGVFLLLQQKGNNGINFDNRKNKLSTSFKRCNEHQRRKGLLKKEKAQSPFNSFISMKKSQIPNVLSKKRNMEDDIALKYGTYSSKQKKISLGEDSYLFEKYFNSFIPYFKGLISNNININDKILKLRESLDACINALDGDRKNFYQLIKRIISPLNKKEKTNQTTTRILAGRVIKYLENDFERKNYLSMNPDYDKKEKFIYNYANNIVYTYFSNFISGTQGQAVFLWAKIYFFIRFGWKKECIIFIATVEGLNINESGLREIKESLDDSYKISIQNYNEFKRIMNQEKKESNPFKHACMVYITKIPEELDRNILLEINDHLWFNLSLIYPQDSYCDLINKEYGKENENDKIIEIDTSSNQDNNGILELTKLKELQDFYGNNNNQLLILSNKSSNFDYIILLVSLLKFQTALNYMIKNNMYIDAINFFFILKQIGLYSDFDEINENKINLLQKSVYEESKKSEIIYQILPKISNNIPALMLYLIFSEENFIPALSYLLVMTEAFGVLNNYDKSMQLFQNNNDIMIADKNNNIKDFKVCLKDLIDKETLKKLCKKIFEIILKHKMKNNANLNPLFNTFKDLKMLTELTGILINKSIELINLKKPLISTDMNGNIMIELSERNKRLLGLPLILNYFGALINDANQLFIEKQNEKEDLIKNNQDNIYDEKIFYLEREIEENNINLSILNQLPIIESIYEYIYRKNFNHAFALFIENITIVKVGSECKVQNELENLINEFVEQFVLKQKYGFMELYVDALYLYAWLFDINLKFLQMKGYDNIIENFRNKSKALSYISQKLEKSQKEEITLNYIEIIKKIKDEANQIEQFYINFT